MSEPRWLSEHEQAVWRSYLEATHLLTEVLGRELAAATSAPSLSHADYEVFVRLSEAPGHRLRMSELADRTLASRSRLSHAVGRLEAAGMVRRESCATDGRGAFAVLTAAGLASLEAAAPTHVTGVREHLFDQLDAAQVDALGTICAALRDHLRAPAAATDGEAARGPTGAGDPVGAVRAG